jgi:hypothetical protein
MPVFHTSTSATTDTLLGQLPQAVAALRERARAAGDFEVFERKLHALFVAAEREVLAEALERLDVDLPYVDIEGQRHYRVLRSSETYTTAVGSVRVMRTLYRHSGERAVVPLERCAGLIAGHWTPLAARQATGVVAHLTPAEGEALFRELGAMTPSKSSLDRLPKALSGVGEAQRESFEGAVRAPEQGPAQAVTLAVSLDGVRVPMKDGAREAKRAAGKETRGPAGYQEVGCATLSFYDAAGTRLRSVRLARMPQAKKATLKAMRSAEIHTALAQRPDLTLVKLADGAPDNWTYLADAVPAGVELVDFFHAAEQLQAAFETAYGEHTPVAQAQSAKYRRRLRDAPGGVDKVIRALSYRRSKHPRRQRIRQVLGYFRRHRARMHYTEAAARNLSIGSGVVEAAGKTLASQRLKRSGMRWRHEGGQAILTFRALVQSERFERAWKLLSRTYHGAVTLPENVVPFPYQRPA